MIWNTASLKTFYLKTIISYDIWYLKKAKVFFLLCYTNYYKYNSMKSLTKVNSTMYQWDIVIRGGGKGLMMLIHMNNTYNRIWMDLVTSEILSLSLQRGFPQLIKERKVRRLNYLSTTEYLYFSKNSIRIQIRSFIQFILCMSNVYT